MRIQILMLRPDFYWSFNKLAQLLRSRGHVVSVVCDRGKDFNHKHIPNLSFSQWSKCDFTEVEDFAPDVILTWNDIAWYEREAIPKLRERYKVMVVENGWLPQAGNVYLLETNAFASRELEEGFEKFIPDDRDISPSKIGYEVKYTLDRPYVFVPLQLESDTSQFFSPHFKTMQSFVDFIAVTSKGVPVVIKEHPKKEVRVASHAANCVLYEGPRTTHELIAGAKAVVGINSTCLIEALVFKKPVYAFGKSPGSHAFLPADVNDPEFMKNVLHSDTRVDDALIEKTVRYLLANQFNVNNPPVWAAKRIESRC